MRATCRLAASVLDYITPHVVPGVTTGQLDKLDYLISRLKRHGIYVDLNLHVSRSYPDRPRWEGMPDFFKGVDNFDPEMIAQQRRYAGEQGRFGPPDEHFMRIDVEDTGIGIPADKLQRVFESFYQVDNSITREYGGTGLGLAIVKRFIEAHGGEVWVESQERIGTVFTLILPFDRAEVGEIRV